jgi:hypothetical protein
MMIIAMMLALSGTLAGAMIGRRLNVFALIPAIAFVSVTAGAIWLAWGGSFGSAIIVWASFLTCLQLGYLCGAALQLFIRPRGAIRGAAMRRTASRA